MKRVAIALIGLLLLVGFATAGGLFYMRSAVPEPPRGAVLLECLEALASAAIRDTIDSVGNRQQPWIGEQPKHESCIE